MKITAIDTVRLEEFSNILWLNIHTDEGLIGLGETWFGAAAVEAYIHESVAPVLLGRDPLQIEQLSRDLTPYVGFSGSGVETRGRSAVDIALWDIFGKACGQPLYQMLGGLCRDRIRTYNTCAGYKYVRNKPDWGTDDWGLDDKSDGPYEDLDGFLNNAGELAVSLLEQNITGMKIWPLDFAALASDGYDISSAKLNKAIEPFEKIRNAVGDRMDIMVECHALWRFPAILKVLAALEQFNPYWLEDLVRNDSLSAYSDIAAATNMPICASETLGGKQAFNDLLDTGTAGIIMPDVAWCGGVTEVKKIAAIADSYQRPVALHDCQGPVVLQTSVHLSLALPNSLIQESVRAFYAGWYGELVTPVPQPVDGYFYPPDGAGLGIELLPDIFDRGDVTVVTSKNLWIVRDKKNPQIQYCA